MGGQKNARDIRPDNVSGQGQTCPDNVREQKNVRPDMAVLPESSVLYEKQQESTEREKLSQMSRGQKAAYIAEYYGRNLVIAAALIAFVVFLILHFAFRKGIALYVLAVNTTTMQTGAMDEPSCYDSVLISCGVDPARVEVSVDSSIGVSPDPEDAVNKTNVQAVQNRFMANAVDVFFSDEELLYSLAEFDYLADLRDCLPQEVLEACGELVYVTSLETGETYPAGIRLPGNAWIEESGWYAGNAVVGIGAGTQHPETAAALVREVLGYPGQ